MSTQVTYIDEEDRLDLSFTGNLDVSVSGDITDIGNELPAELNSCIIDLTSVDHVFDSGVALLQDLCRRLLQKGVTVVILSDHPAVRERVDVDAYCRRTGVRRASVQHKLSTVPSNLATGAY
mgnify:FL=1